MPMRVGPAATTTASVDRYPPYLTPTAIRYEGPLRGLLSRVTSRYSLYWTYEAGRVVIARYATRTFKLSALPSQVVVSAEVGGTAAAAGGTDSEVSSSTDGITQRAAYTMDVNLWKAVESTVDAMLSPNGRLFVSKESGALTVTDTVDVQRLVESYVKDLNRDLQRQVNVRVTVLSVNFNDEDAYGINWDVIRQNSDSLLEFVTPDLISTAVGSLTGTVVKPSSRWNGSSAVIKALSTIGRTSVVTQSSLTTLNGQPAPIQVTESTGYLKEVTTTLTDTGTETGLTPGTILTGVVMTVTPRVVGHSQMMLQYSLDFSELLDIKEFSSGTNTIQLPEIAKRALTQQVLISNGEMLILSGLETARDSSKTEGVEGQWWLGGRDSRTNRERLVVVIEQMLIGARSVAAAD
jgi:type IVB pilus formation R64 PilN family outer membrane protein